MDEKEINSSDLKNGATPDTEESPKTGAKEKRGETYMSEGMGIGLCLGTAIGIFLENIAVGVGIGLCLGLAVGSGIKKKEKSE